VVHPSPDENDLLDSVDEVAPSCQIPCPRRHPREACSGRLVRQEAQRQAVVELSWLIVLAAKSPISAAASSGIIRPRLAVVSEMMITAVSGARTTPLK
jgi:hypothetical protein